MTTRTSKKNQKVPEWIKQIKSTEIKNPKKIPIYAPYLIGNESLYVNRALDSEWVSSKGDFVEQLEHSFATYCGSPYAVSCSSGTSALFLALATIDIHQGDEVLVPTFTMISTAFAVSYHKAKPVFIDCDSTFGNINIAAIEAKITKKTKAIIPVHIYGNPCEMDDIHQIAKQYSLRVIEDGAEALGSTYHGHKIGSLSEFTAFSMYSNKIVTSGEGGMITLQSAQMYKKMKKLNNYAFSNVRHFWHQHLGYNFRLSNLEAALGLAQLEHIQETLQKKDAIAKWYRTLLQSVQEYFVEIPIVQHSYSNKWMIAYRIQIPKFVNTKLQEFLASKNIETRSFFLPLHVQPVYRKPEFEGKFPNADHLAQTGILLPSGPGLTLPEVERVCVAILSFFHS